MSFDCFSVEQKDLFVPYLTVRETLYFYAYIRVPDITRKDRNHCVDYIAKALGLTDCMDGLVGNDYMKGISGVR